MKIPSIYAQDDGGVNGNGGRDGNGGVFDNGDSDVEELILEESQSFSSFAIWESGRKKPSIITTINLELYFLFIF